MHCSNRFRPYLYAASSILLLIALAPYTALGQQGRAITPEMVTPLQPLQLDRSLTLPLGLDEAGKIEGDCGFGNVPLGTVFDPITFTLQNTGGVGAADLTNVIGQVAASNHFTLSNFAVTQGSITTSNSQGGTADIGTLTPGQEETMSFRMEAIEVGQGSLNLTGTHSEGTFDPLECQIPIVLFPITITGTKWDDENGNGNRDGGEPGVGGVLIYYDENDNGQFDGGEPSTTTGSNGAYELVFIPPGPTVNVVIREVVPDGASQTFPGGANGFWGGTLNHGETISNADFGNSTQPFIEVDDLENTTALVQLVGGPLGNRPQVFILSGPTIVHVTFDGPNEGDAEDDDNDNLDEVQTELVSMNLTDGNVQLVLNSNEESLGEIEEQQNNNPGTLDLPPFGTGKADSFFDVFFEIRVAGLILRNAVAFRIESVISEKPPFDRYFHVIPPGGPIELVDQNGNPTGIFIIKAEHDTGIVELDSFPGSLAEVNLIHPDNTEELLTLIGPTDVAVFFEGPEEGDVRDDDDNGLDEVETEMIALELSGTSSLGPLTVRLAPDQSTNGIIEEDVNNTEGVLDVPPFGTGTAQSCFNVFFEVEVAGLFLHTERPKEMCTTITMKPPGPGDIYFNPDRIPLLFPNGDDSGFAIGNSSHQPNPPRFVEIDKLEATTALVQLVGGPLGNEPVPFILRGPAEVHVFFEGENEGDAEDNNNNGLDEVNTRLVLLNLTDGNVNLSLNPDQVSPGQIEEQQNNNNGRLDLDPFHPGDADSFFDVFFQLNVNGLILRNAQALRIEAVISEKPPFDRYVHLIPPNGPIELVDLNGQGTGIFIIEAEHDTRFIEIDKLANTTALVQLVGGILGPRPQSFILSGPAEVHVFFEGQEGDAKDDDENGRDEVNTQLISMNLTDGNITLQLNNNQVSLGQIEELLNSQSGILDLPPFGEGQADSFFEVYFEILVAGMVLRNTVAFRIEAVISEKPPYDRYIHIVPPGGPVELVDENGNPTGIFIIKGEHNTGIVELDPFPGSLAQVNLIHPDGREEPLSMVGPTLAAVHFEGPEEGDVRDDDNNGLDEVETEMLQLDLTGNSSLGPIEVRLRTDQASSGFIEEQINSTPGVLDVPPFGTGVADSCFDVYFEILVGGLILHTERPKHMCTTIRNKPPGPGDVYFNPDRIPLLFENGDDSGFAIGNSSHEPNPERETEIDIMEETTALVQLAGGPLGAAPVPFILRGSAEAHVFFEGNAEGDAKDDNGNNLDDVVTRLVSIDLTDGDVRLTLNPNKVSGGQIEEQENNVEGRLDVQPFGQGIADSFFDVFFQVEVAGTIVHNKEALRISTPIKHKPPFERYFHIIPPDGNIELFAPDGSPTGIFIVKAEHFTGYMGIDRFRQESQTALDLIKSDGSTERVTLTGPTTMRVFFEGPLGYCRDDNGDGLCEIGTGIDIEWTGNSSFGPITVRTSPTRRSVGLLVERANNTSMILDVPPFGTGIADCFFDIYMEVIIGGGKGGDVYVNETPKRISAVITEEPPQNAVFENFDTTALVDANGNPAPFSLGGINYQPVPVSIEVEQISEEVPLEFELEANYPNPFTRETVIPFGIPRSEHVVLEVYDLLGRRIETLIDRVVTAGRHEATWQVDSLPAGIYLIRLTVGNATLTQRATLTK